ncbi:MAG TPA: cache domain-containing protein, partial [bacterium]
MKLGTKLLIIFLSISILPLAGSGLVARYLSSEALSEKAFDQLVAMREVKKLEVAARMQQLVALMDNVRADVRFTEGLPAFATAFADGGREGLQYTIAQSEREFGLNVFVDSFEFLDVLLIDLDGNVVYAAKQGPEWGSNLRTGPFRESSLAAATQSAVEATTFVDFAHYAPIDGPAAFILTPILDEALKPAGTAAFRLGVGTLNKIMHARTGLGETGETFLVGPQGRMRSDSVQDAERRSVAASFRAPEQGSVHTEAARKALAGESGAILSENYAGRQVLVAYG